MHATGDYASGHCSYSLAVRGNSEFLLSGVSDYDVGEFDCDHIWVGVGGTTWQTVPTYTVKVDNLTISSIGCENVW